MKLELKALFVSLEGWAFGEWPAAYQLVGEVMAHQGDDG